MAAPAMALRALALAAALVAPAARVLGPDSATGEAILALDTDHSGKVERAEVEAFAKAQGLSAADVRAEFAELDTDGNGELEESEISQTLSERPASPAAATPSLQAAAPAAPAAVATAPSSVFAPPQQLLSPATLPVLTAAAPTTEPPKQVAPSVTPAVAPAVVPVMASAVAPTELVKTESSSSVVEMQAVAAEAQENAGKALAEVFARTAAKALESRSLDVAKAEKLEEAARALRGQTSQLRETANQLTVSAATAAAEAVLKESAQQVQSMESQALAAEQQAAQKRMEAQEAMSKALKAQQDLKASLSQEV